jgi:tetratricopeptide (TPR) repeat protein
MPKSRLPGLPTSAALMLTAILPVAVTFTGRIPTSYEVLRDFQTTIAAFVAVGAATLAYRAAMAKVALDREIHNRQQTYLRLGLYRRLTSQLDRLLSEIDNALGFLNVELATAAKQNSKTVKWENWLLIIEGKYEEIEEAWQKIELLLSEAFEHLDTIRSSLARVQEIYKDHDEDETVNRWTCKRYFDGCWEIHTHAQLFAGELAAALARMKEFEV